MGNTKVVKNFLNVNTTTLSKLLKYKYKTYPEFLALRKKIQGYGDPNTFRIGGSDIGVVMGVDDYRSAKVFFYEACEFVQKEEIKSAIMHRGHIQEPVIYKEYWRYVNPEDPSDEAYLDNYYGEKKVYRTARKSNCIYINPKYPFMFCTPDYEIPRCKYNKRGVLEVKSPTWRASEKYESGIATSYVSQVHAQMLVLGVDYSELFAVEDASFIKMFRFESISDTIRNATIDRCQDFQERVLKGKKIVYDNTLSQLEKEQLLDAIAPEDDQPELYKEFLKAKHRPENAKATVTGTGEQLGIVIEYLMQKENIKGLTEENTKIENIIRGWFMGNIGTISFEGAGDISYKDKLNVPKRLLKSFA